MLDSSIKISIVCPIYRAENSVKPLVSQLSKKFADLGLNYELVLVDDRSPDNSWNALVYEAKRDDRVKIIRLSRNFGQQLAVSAGIEFSTGDYCIVMDGYLQNPINAIDRIIEQLDNGFDMVYCKSKVRNNWFDGFTSKLFWFILVNVFKVQIVTGQLMMRGMSRRMADYYASYNELTRTVAGINLDIGLESTVIEVENQKREIGKSNYNFLKRFNLMIDIILNITTAPLNILINLSLLSILLTSLVSLYYVYLYLTTSVQPGFTSIILAIFFFGSLTLLTLGIIGRYLANIYSEVKRRPKFLVDQKINFHV